MPSDYVWQDRPWGKGNNPKTAVHEWLKENKNFEIDNYPEYKLLLTFRGFLYKKTNFSRILFFNLIFVKEPNQLLKCISMGILSKFIYLISIYFFTH